MIRRSGTSLAELVLVAWLFAFVLAAVAGFAAAQGRLSAAQHERTRAAEAVRTASIILDGELRHLTAGDVGPATSEAVYVRAIRGGGVVCRGDGVHLLVRYRGVRLPNPRKDSVTLVTNRSPGRESRFALTGVAADTACGGALRLTLDPRPSAVHGLALVYETGSYHFSGGALRYRIGGGGRQPLTEPLFTGAGFHGGTAGAGLSLRLELNADSLPRLGPLPYDLHLRVLNEPAPP